MFDARKFRLLCRAFFAQFFTSETVSSDDELRRQIVWILAFLLLPGILLLIHAFFDYQGIVLRAIRYQQFDHLDDTLEWIAFLFVTYSMVTVGLVAVCEWDALVFDRRDAMVLSPLPLRGATIVTAKVAALGAFLLAASTTVNLLNAIVFAFATGDRLGFDALVRHFVAILTSTFAAATFVFAALVTLRGVIGLAAGPRVAAALGSLLQFAFVLALLGIVILCPAVWRVPHRELVNPTATGWLPSSWFLGLFEQLRGSTRAYFEPLATRAWIATAAVAAGAVATSIVGFRRQMERALAPDATARLGGTARVARALAGILAGGHGVAPATSDFILLTLGRNRTQQTLVAVNAAVGVALVCAGLAQARSLASLTHPTTTVLWIPLVVAYWLAVGFRAACFVPSELQSAWTFAANAPGASPGYRAAVRAAMLAFVLPPTLVVAAAVTFPLLGPAVAVRHLVFVGLMTIAIVEAAALTIDFVPFTRAYEPGHARLKTRWWLYVAGVYAAAWWPARIELATIDQPNAFVASLAAVVAAIVLCDIAGRRRAGRWAVRAHDQSADPFATITVLDLRSVAPNA
jgi:hypothetical protein